MKSKSILLGTAVLFYVITGYARQNPAPQKPLATPANSTANINFTAKSANVSEPGIPVKITLTRWSTEQERIPILAALNPALAPPPAAGGERGGRGRGARAAQPNDVAPDPALDEVNGQDAAAGAARGGGGARGGARGRGARGGGDAAPAKPVDPISNLTDAIAKAPTIGYIWTNEVVGYSIKYAFHMPLADGGERIILATDRRLGEFANAWKPTGSVTPTNYGFTVVEMRLDAKGAGEGKTSLTTSVSLDNEAKTLVLENYSGTPATLASVKK